MLCLLLFVVLFALAQCQVPGPCPGCTAVFYEHYAGQACFRIPSIIQTHAGTLLAFAENRESSCKDQGPHHAIVLRRSEDGGATWEKMITVREGRPPCPGCPSAISNPNPVEVRFPNGSHAVLLHFDTFNGGNVTSHGLDMQMWSHDDGRTWSSATALIYPPAKNDGGLIGPAVGIQAASGRLYFSFAFLNSHVLYYSDDYGTSWRSAAPISGLGECAIAFLHSPEDGRVLMNCRVGGGTRAQVVWTPESDDPGHVPVAGPMRRLLVDPDCQGSLVNINGTVLFSNANTTDSRSHMTVKSSLDGGQTYDAGVLVWKGPSAYSQLVPLNGRGRSGAPGVGLLFEAGILSSSETISFVRVNFENASQD